MSVGGRCSYLFPFSFFFVLPPIFSGQGEAGIEIIERIYYGEPLIMVHSASEVGKGIESDETGMDFF